MSTDSKFSLEDILGEERETAVEENAPLQEETAAPAENAGQEVLPPQPAAPVPYYPPYTPPEKKKKEKKKGFFARRKEKKLQKQNFEASEDMYYGLQLKPIDEYTRGFDATGEISLQQDGFKKLFDGDTTELDDEVAKNFERLQRERRRRVAEAVENAGVDIDAVENELGIVAPVPVSAFSGDPYAKQHGIENDKGGENLPDFQKAMLQDAQTRTMEIKLDMENESFGVQQAKVMPEVDEESVRHILESVQEAPGEGTEFTDVSSFSEEKMAEMAAQRAENGEALPEDGEPQAETEPGEEAPVRYSLPVNDVTEYRTRDLPVHIINADVLQSALLSEARVYTEEETEDGTGRMKLRFKDHGEQEGEEEVYSGETLDDYTGPADAKSIAHDLRTTMRELTVRLLATGVCTAILIMASFICEAGFGPGNTVLSGAIGYTVVSLIFLLVAVGFCAKTISNGIRSLLDLRANSDSAAAVAAVAVLLQTLSMFFYTDVLASGEVHIYAGIAAAVLFLNTLGKLTMVRRIHSNFRFVASRENKYAVRIVDDYNASLKLAGSSVVSQPVIAYQQKADFLKRFLQISYEPDPAETASQTMAPVGLLSSLLLCVLALIVTKDPALSVTALAAACCVNVAVMNMLAVNLPVSRLSRRLRRSGAMVASYEGIKRMSAVNAVLVDSGDLFPRGTVVLNGVKPLNEETLEAAVLDAGALVQHVGGPLCGVFDQVLSEYEGELPEVEAAHFEVGAGIVGKVEGREVLIGSRGLLYAHGAAVPDPALESKYTTGNRQVLYVAEDGVVSAMLILTYAADRRKKEEIRELESNGVALIVRTTDANITPHLLSRLFGMDVSAIQVIGADTDAVCDALIKETAGRVDAYAATKGRADSMMSVVSACIDEKKNINFIVAMQNAAVVIGFILVAFLTFISGVKQISALALLVYEAFWVLAAVILPKLKNKFK